MLCLTVGTIYNREICRAIGQWGKDLPFLSQIYSFLLLHVELTSTEQRILIWDHCKFVLFKLEISVCIRFQLQTPIIESCMSLWSYYRTIYFKKNVSSIFSKLKKN